LSVEGTRMAHQRSQAQVVEQVSVGIDGKRFVSDIEIERSYGIPKKTLQNWRILGKGPPFRKFGRGVKYEVRLLEVWIDGLPTGGDGVPTSAVRRIVAPTTRR
jgi:hypothetical protein